MQPDTYRAFQTGRLDQYLPIRKAITLKDRAVFDEYPDIHPAPWRQRLRPKPLVRRPLAVTARHRRLAVRGGIRVRLPLFAWACQQVCTKSRRPKPALPSVGVSSLKTPQPASEYRPGPTAAGSRCDCPTPISSSHPPSTVSIGGGTTSSAVSRSSVLQGWSTNCQPARLSLDARRSSQMTTSRGTRIRPDSLCGESWGLREQRALQNDLRVMGVRRMPLSKSRMIRQESCDRIRVHVASSREREQP